MCVYLQHISVNRDQIPPCFAASPVLFTPQTTPKTSMAAVASESSDIADLECKRCCTPGAGSSADHEADHFATERRRCGIPSFTYANLVQNHQTGPYPELVRNLNLKVFETMKTSEEISLQHILRSTHRQVSSSSLEPSESTGIVLFSSDFGVRAWLMAADGSLLG